MQSKQKLDNINKTKKTLINNYELNLFDSIIEKNIVEENELVNVLSLPEEATRRKQVQRSELPTKNKKPTPVTLLNVWG